MDRIGVMKRQEEDSITVMSNITFYYNGSNCIPSAGLVGVTFRVIKVAMCLLSFDKKVEYC